MTTTAPQTATLTQPPAANTTAVLLAANGARKGVIIQNDGSTALSLAFASTASATAYTILIPAAGSWTMGDFVYGGPISGIWAGSPTGNARVTTW